MSGKNNKDAILLEPFAVACTVFLFFTMTALVRAETLPTHHVRQAVISGQAKLLNRLPETQTLQLTILLPLRDQAGLDQFLLDVHDPSSPSYGRFLTAAESTARFGPTQEDYDAVVYFAESKGMTVTNLSPNRLLIDVTASVASIESTFHVKMGIYQHPTENRTFFAPDREPTVDLYVPLWHIGGLDNYSTPRPLYLKGAPGAMGNTTGSGPGGNFLGSDRRAAYYGGTALTGANQSVGLFQLDGYNLSDVQNYFTNAHQSLNVPINNVLVDGASAGTDGDDTEQVIDIIEAVSMAPGLSQVLMYIGPRSSFTAGVTDSDIFSKMESDDTAKQLSCSWTWTVADYTQNDQIFRLMAANGQNLFVASGDDGSYPNSSGFYYPAEDAYITAVGGTSLTTNGAGGSYASETAWGGSTDSCTVPPYYGSGGGVSPDGIPIPSYQQLAGVINSSNNGSTTLRNVPDVAAEANCDNYYCANGSCGQNLGGTSLAAPMWAGYLALANQEQIADGKNSLGFINTPIYDIGLGSSYGAAFHDINIGNNKQPLNPNLYTAVTGYDLVTGWGSPHGSGLINALTGTTGSYTVTLSVGVYGNAQTSAELCVENVCATNSSGAVKGTFGSGSNLSWEAYGPLNGSGCHITGGGNGHWYYEGVGGYFNSSATSGQFTMPAQNISLDAAWDCQ